jgi:hypothetical protein
MNNTKLLATLVGCLVFSGSLSVLAGQTPGAGIEQQLRSQYPITIVGTNGYVARPGSVVVVQQDGITAFPVPYEWPCNTYKRGGRIKQSTMCAINYSLGKDQARPLQVGEKAYLTAIQVKPSEVVFKVQTCCGDPNSAPFRAGVSFQFPKGYLESMKLSEIQDTISQIFAPDASSPAQGADQSQPNPPQGAQQTPELYFMRETGAHLQLNPDGSFSMQAANGQVSPGHWTVNGDTLVLTYSATGRSSTYRIQGDRMYANTGLAWVRQGETPPPSPPTPPPPPPPALKLPSTYVSAQTPADQLHLNADSTFSLQEAGQSYRGNFVQNGSTLELTIADTNTPTTATIQGNNLTDSSGQTWVLREQSGGTAPGGATLQNEDIIKMAKAGFDDSIIIAKIGSSKCQFDTSTDALIRLKQSGVSAAVIRAIVAGK